MGDGSASWGDERRDFQWKKKEKKPDGELGINMQGEYYDVIKTESELHKLKKLDDWSTTMRNFKENIHWTEDKVTKEIRLEVHSANDMSRPLASYCFNFLRLN